MIITLEKVNKKINDNNEIVRKIEKIDLEVDFSLNTQMRWESKFPKQAEKEDLETYISRIRNIDNINSGVILASLKGFYCLFDTELLFKDFVKIFDPSEQETLEKNIETIKTVSNMLYEGAAEKN